MHKCLFCGYENPSEKAKFCVECGPVGPASGWESRDIDQPENVRAYLMAIGELFFEADSTYVDRFAKPMREKLKITHDVHARVLDCLEKKKNDVRNFANFKLEFNENVVDAFAKHDTCLWFKFTNLSGDQLFKVSLSWCFPEGTDRIEFNNQRKSFVKPGQEIMIAGIGIFERIGIKNISDLLLTITNQFGESVLFRGASFTVRVSNPNQRITQNISTHNQISIEGRGVVDASRMGAGGENSGTGSAISPRWRPLSCGVLIDFTELGEQISKIDSNGSIAVDASVVTHSASSANAGDQIDETNIDELLINAKNGNSLAQYLLGRTYYDGKGIHQNYDLALEWFQKAADQGNADAQYYLGNCYEDGEGVSVNQSLAFQWYQKAADQGHAGSQCNLGTCYSNGEGVPVNQSLAFQWYQKAADQGYAIAQFNLAVCYQNGEGVPINQSLVVHWLQKAADQGYAIAQFHLGVCYGFGTGVPLNQSLAFLWYQKAADQGNADAQYYLGKCYEDGEGVSVNQSLAFQWYQKAADQGHADAQFNLGVCYQNGQGVPVNLDLAVEWFRKSACQGHEEAEEWLRDLTNE
jgi:TPR repeat protein